MEDLLQHFTDPNIMDIKLGRRTFLEFEVKNPVQRKDLYEKMVSLDPDSPTDLEREQQAITKLRYMQFREKESSSAEFGFRIEALRLSGEPPTTNLKKIKTKEQSLDINLIFLNNKKEQKSEKGGNEKSFLHYRYMISQILKKFVKDNKTTQKSLCQRLKYIRQQVETSEFFMSHEVLYVTLLENYKHQYIYRFQTVRFHKKIHRNDLCLKCHLSNLNIYEYLYFHFTIYIVGSSVLIMYDKKGHTGAWLIDFSKTVPMKTGEKLTHRAEWVIIEIKFIYKCTSNLFCFKFDHFDKILRYFFLLYNLETTFTFFAKLLKDLI
ncbi:hypothetical protein KUTeg_001942 [Tegillarca granosa]|uniref:Kinase n=1 Tax=Tegillarca granosa TaxID=220873 RepID=A0ABQ9FX90_TEGGR|nr:hypothetical protein KUTeg_001942 [Tegillarca granosa]